MVRVYNPTNALAVWSISLSSVSWSTSEMTWRLSMCGRSSLERIWLWLIWSIARRGSARTGNLRKVILPMLQERRRVRLMSLLLLMWMTWSTLGLSVMIPGKCQSSSSRLLSTAKERTDSMRGEACVKQDIEAQKLSIQPQFDNWFREVRDRSAEPLNPSSQKIGKFQIPSDCNVSNIVHGANCLWRALFRVHEESLIKYLTSMIFGRIN